MAINDITYSTLTPRLGYYSKPAAEQPWPCPVGHPNRGKRRSHTKSRQALLMPLMLLVILMLMLLLMLLMPEGAAADSLMPPSVTD